MIPLVEVQEQSFAELEELRETIAKQDRQLYQIPIHEVSLDENGILSAGRFKGKLTKPALLGLFKTEGIPVDFALDHCPTDLLVDIVKRLAREQDKGVTIQAVNGVATGVMPEDRKPIRHDILLDRLGTDCRIREATLTADCLRIMAITIGAKEFLPSDTFEFGWEIITSENGWRPTDAWRWAVREVCANGMVGFDKTPLFRRAYNSRQPVLVSLQGLLHALEDETRLPDLEPAITWAADRRIGQENRLVTSYLSQRLGGDATRLELGGVTANTSWYELMNAVTSLARLHSAELRRRYEVEGGMLLDWFSRQGRGKPPWRRVSCDECEAWD